MDSSAKAKPISIKKRLQRSIKKQSSLVEVMFRKGVGRGICEPMPNFEDRTAWAERVRQILNLKNSDKATKKAFDAFGFDADDPRNWTALLRLFAEMLEPEFDDLAVGPKSAGRKIEWPFERRRDLVLEIDRIQRTSPSKITDDQACRRIIDSKSPTRVVQSKVDAMVKQAVTGRRQWRRRAGNGKIELPAFLGKGKN